MALLDPGTASRWDGITWEETRENVKGTIMIPAWKSGVKLRYALHALEYLVP